METGRQFGLLAVLGLCASLAGCGGGGGDDGPPPPAATVTLTANPTSVTAGQGTTLTWSSTNATTCTATQGWSGTKATSGTEVIAALAGTTTFALSCSGGGPAATQSVTVTVTAQPAPIVTLTATPSTVAAGGSSTLDWTATNATTCTASGGWTGTRSTSGSQSVGPIAATTSYVLTCTGTGGTAAQTATVTVGAAGDVIVSGTITFERPLFRTNGTGLDMGNPIVAPARGVIVEAINPATRARIGSAATTDVNGEYSLSVPQSTQIIVSARAEMVSTTAPTWNFKVLNNTNGNALYVLDSAAFNTGSANSIRDLRATTGWGGTSYTGTRAAAPFAILDTVYKARELVRSADPATSFAPLNLYWSVANRTAEGCTTNGNIGITFYTGGAPALGSGNCTPNVAIPAGIYILGDYASGAGDTDEFDQHVIGHEFGHYFEDVFSRSDSIGGSHGSGERLDLRLAFGEGFGTAFSAMVLNDPAYRDSGNGVAGDFTINLETEFPSPEGWYSEFSIAEILWDLFDPANDDPVAMGFTPIYDVFTDAQRTTPALTSIFSFAEALRAANPAQVAGINTLLSGESISTNSNAFGNNEANSGGVPTALPIYQTITTAQPVLVCSSSDNGDQNKLGYRRFLLLNVTSAATAVTIAATGTVDPDNPASLEATDPDIFVWRSGDLVALGNDVGQTETITQQPLAAGMHVIEVYDYEAVGAVQRCMSVSVTGL